MRVEKLKKLSRFIKITIVGILFMSFLYLSDSLGSSANEFEKEYASESIYVMNREDKSEIMKLNHKDKVYPASLTKIMTTLVALEHIENLSAIAPVDIETYREMIAQNASMAGFYGKEQTTYRDLLYGTILSSGGEAANSLAIHVAGSTESFVERMNDKAVEIGLEGTHFTNPEGLHNRKQYTTAADMGKLLDYALNDGNFKAIFTKDVFHTTSTLDHPNGIFLQSTVLSKLNGINQSGFEIIGGKSGTTFEAGQCWITLGEKDNVEYIVVVMGAKLDNLTNPSDKQIEDTLKIYENIE